MPGELSTTDVSPSGQGQEPLWIVRSEWRASAFVDPDGALADGRSGRAVMDSDLADNCLMHLSPEGAMLDPVDVHVRAIPRFVTQPWAAPVLRASANPLILCRADLIVGLADVIDDAQVCEAIVNDNPAWRLITPPLLPTPPVSADGVVDWGASQRLAADRNSAVWSLDLVREPIVDDTTKQAFEGCGLGDYFEFVPQANLEWLLLNQPPYNLPLS